MTHRLQLNRHDRHASVGGVRVHGDVDLAADTVLVAPHVLLDVAHADHAGVREGAGSVWKVRGVGLEEGRTSGHTSTSNVVLRTPGNNVCIVRRTVDEELVHRPL